MRIIEKYKLKVGDNIECNLDGRNIRKYKINGVIGRIINKSIYILNNEHDGNTYTGWRDDCIKYNKKYSWVIDNVDIDLNGLIFNKKQKNIDIEFYNKYL